MIRDDHAVGLAAAHVLVCQRVGDRLTLQRHGRPRFVQMDIRRAHGRAGHVAAGVYVVALDVPNILNGGAILHEIIDGGAKGHLATGPRRQSA